MLGDGSLVAYWTENRRSRASDPAKKTWDAEDIYFSSSRNGGKTWTTPAVLHRDLSDCEHSFLSVAPLADDQIAAVWLDGRDKTYALRHSITKAAGKPGEETALDTDVCSCCPTAMARTGEGLIVAYRDHTGETRDISYVRFAQGRWNEPQPLRHDGWKINGCPVNGVDLDANGRSVVAAWFTAANDQPQVKVAFSNDAGASFSAPVRVDEGRPIGRAAVALRLRARWYWLTACRSMAVSGAPCSGIARPNIRLIAWKSCAARHHRCSVHSPWAARSM